MKTLDTRIKNVKINVCGRSEEVQKKLFELGAEWNVGGAEVFNTDYPYLFVDNYGNIMHTSNIEFFNDCKERRITVEELLSYEPKQEEQFTPFQKVLVRGNVNQNWQADFFSHKNGYVFYCIGNCWSDCIPYEGNEHLIGTTNNPK